MYYVRQLEKGAFSTYQCSVPRKTAPSQACKSTFLRSRNAVSPVSGILEIPILTCHHDPLSLSLPMCVSRLNLDSDPGNFSIRQTHKWCKLRAFSL